MGMRYDAQRSVGTSKEDEALSPVKDGAPLSVNTSGGCQKKNPSTPIYDDSVMLSILHVTHVVMSTGVVFD